MADALTAAERRALLAVLDAVLTEWRHTHAVFRQHATDPQVWAPDRADYLRRADDLAARIAGLEAVRAKLAAA